MYKLPATTVGAAEGAKEGVVDGAGLLVGVGELLGCIEG
jgi:hypothetical protein